MPIIITTPDVNNCRVCGRESAFENDSDCIYCEKKGLAGLKVQSLLSPAIVKPKVEGRVIKRWADARPRRTTRKQWQAAFRAERVKVQKMDESGNLRDDHGFRQYCASTALIMGLKETDRGLNFTIIDPGPGKEKIYIHGPSGPLPG